MSQKGHNPGPVPKGNRSHVGPVGPQAPDQVTETTDSIGTGFHEQDPKRRLGDFTGAGEHARQQPGPLNDGGRRHGEDPG